MTELLESRAALTAEDRIEIQELIARYSVGEDNGDADALAALFAEDGATINSRGVATVGRDAIAAAARRRWTNEGARREVHWATNIIVEAAEHGATALSYHMILVVADDEIRVRGLTAKRDHLRREGGRWLFAKREALPLAAG